MALAKKEGNPTVLALIDMGRPGFLIRVHPADLPTAAAEFESASHNDTVTSFSQAGPDRPDHPPSLADDDKENPLEP
jgi:hypothetical protein